MKTFIKPKSPEKIAAENEAKREQTAAQKRLEDRGEMDDSSIVSVEYNGETWYLKVLNFEDLSLAAMLINRDKKGRVQLFNRKVMRSVIVAALHIGVAANAEDPESSYFSVDDAELYVRKPKQKHLVSFLFNWLVENNPELIPKKA